MTNQITISDITIHRDSKGRYSINDLHKAAGNERRHEPSLWLGLLQTKELIEEILNTEIPVFKNGEESNTGIPVINPPVASRKGRYGGTYVCKELVYSYAMWISAAFALKVIRAYDALVSGNVEVKPKVRQCTATQLIPLRQTAERLITTGLGKIYPDIWKLVHQRFDVEHIHQLQPEQVGEAIEYLNVLEGEYLGRETLPVAVSRQFTDEQLCTLAWLWRASTVMIQAVESVYPLLRVAEHQQAPRYYSITHEYPRTLREAQRILAQATMHIQFEQWRDDNWSRVLPHLRHNDLPRG